MENILLNIWIEMKSGIKVRLISKDVYNSDEKYGDAYPSTTEYGKMMITKQFINAWLE